MQTKFKLNQRVSATLNGFVHTGRIAEIVINSFGVRYVVVTQESPHQSISIEESHLTLTALPIPGDQVSVEFTGKLICIDHKTALVEHNGRTYRIPLDACKEIKA